jgi:hypothetical protein
VPSTGPYPEPKNSSRSAVYLWSFVTSLFFTARICQPHAQPSAGRPPLVGCPRLTIQYIRGYPPYLLAVSSIRNLGTLHAVVIRDPLIIIIQFNSYLFSCRLNSLTANCIIIIIIIIIKGSDTFLRGVSRNPRILQPQHVAGTIPIIYFPYWLPTHVT